MHGLSTLNRLLGKKNKEVSRSTSNLSNSHLESSSQHNKKIPILNNAPFEQTFRVTVYLPKNQLYVERIGAKTKLEKLMNDVCDSKSLSIDKYEFRHPGDMSQVFDNDKTIGEVGLNELRLVLKSESRYNVDFRRYHSQPDDIMSKYKSSTVPESISSSEISRSNLKNLSKTSPYSSTNSLNSLDSTGMNSTGNKVQPPVAPIRKKKRMAPRPPSENSIPEQEIFSSSTLNVFKEPHSILPRKNFHVSSPQLYNNNNNNYEIAQKSDNNNNNTELRSISSRLNAITRPSSIHISGSNMTTDMVKNLPERQRNNSESSEIQNILRDSGSKQNSLERAKKKNPAPVPPTRSKLKPTPSPRTIQEDINTITEITEVDEQQENAITQKVVGETAPKSIDNYSNGSSKFEDENGNVSKVLLNNSSSSTSENTSSLETEGPISIQILSSEMNVEQQTSSKESVKLPVVSKVHLNHEGDSETRSSSSVENEDEEEEVMTVNIYNVTKSVVTCEKPTIVSQETTSQVISVIEEKHVIIENNNVVVKEETTKKEVIQEEVFRRSPSPEWTYTLPAPPILNSIESINSNNGNSPTDQKSVVVGNKYFSDYMSTVNDNETILSDSNTTTVSAETHIQPIINDRRKPLDDTFIMNTNDFAKPIVIQTAPVVDNQSDKSAEIITSDVEDGYLGNNKSSTKMNPDNDNEISIIEEAPTPRRNIVTNRGEKEEEKKIFVEDFRKNRLVITRSDSFHSIGQQKRSDYEITRRSNLNALPQRSTSFLSLVHSQKAEMRSATIQDLNVPYNRQKSTSELSISDVPSLQSLEVIKNILNCRKASLQEMSSSKSALSDDSKNAPIVEEPKNISSTLIIEPNEKTSPALMTETRKIEVKSTEKVTFDTIEKRDIIKKLETQKSEPVTECNNKNNNDGNKKSETQQWRYSGPPKINFSTWDERPKVQVSVMSDKDYVYNRSQRGNDQTEGVDSSLRKTNYTVIVKKENKEAERHLPKVLGVEYKKDVVLLRHNDNADKINNKSDDMPSSEISSNNAKTLISIKQRPASMDYSSSANSAATNYQNQFVSFNRLANINHNSSNSGSSSKKFAPIVHGFAKLDNISETQTDVKSLPITNSNNNKISEASEKKAEAPIVPAKPAYLRSKSVDIHRQNMKLMPAKTEPDDTDSYDDKPFSQTLRRTGLIERMLNNDKKTESIFGRVLDKSQNSAQEKITFRQYSMPASSVTSPPPPPPPMAFRKSAPIVELNGTDDPRNQLLDAIKNFNMNSLRRK